MAAAGAGGPGVGIPIPIPNPYVDSTSPEIATTPEQQKEESIKYILQKQYLTTIGKTVYSSDPNIIQLQLRIITELFTQIQTKYGADAVCTLKGSNAYSLLYWYAKNILGIGTVDDEDTKVVSDFDTGILIRTPARIEEAIRDMKHMFLDNLPTSILGNTIVNYREVFNYIIHKIPLLQNAFLYEAGGAAGAQPDTIEEVKAFKTKLAELEGVSESNLRIVGVDIKPHSDAFKIKDIPGSDIKLSSSEIPGFLFQSMELQFDGTTHFHLFRMHIVFHLTLHYTIGGTVTKTITFPKFYTELIDISFPFSDSDEYTKLLHPLTFPYTIPGTTTTFPVTTIGIEDMINDLYRMGYDEPDRGKQLKRRKRYIKALNKLICNNPGLIFGLSPEFLSQIIPTNSRKSLCDRSYEVETGQYVKINAIATLIQAIRTKAPSILNFFMTKFQEVAKNYSVSVDGSPFTGEIKDLLGDNSDKIAEHLVRWYSSFSSWYAHPEYQIASILFSVNPYVSDDSYTMVLAHTIREIDIQTQTITKTILTNFIGVHHLQELATAINGPIYIGGSGAVSYYGYRYFSTKNDDLFPTGDIDMTLFVHPSNAKESWNYLVYFVNQLTEALNSTKPTQPFQIIYIPGENRHSLQIGFSISQSLTDLTTGRVIITPLRPIWIHVCEFHMSTDIAMIPPSIQLFEGDSRILLPTADSLLAETASLATDPFKDAYFLVKYGLRYLFMQALVGGKTEVTLPSMPGSTISPWTIDITGDKRNILLQNILTLLQIPIDLSYFASFYNKTATTWELSSNVKRGILSIQPGETSNPQAYLYKLLLRADEDRRTYMTRQEMEVEEGSAAGAGTAASPGGGVGGPANPFFVPGRPSVFGSPAGGAGRGRYGGGRQTRRKPKGRKVLRKTQHRRRFTSKVLRKTQHRRLKRKTSRRKVRRSTIHKR